MRGNYISKLKSKAKIAYAKNTDKPQKREHYTHLIDPPNQQTKNQHDIWITRKAVRIRNWYLNIIPQELCNQGQRGLIIKYRARERRRKKLEENT